MGQKQSVPVGSRPSQSLSGIQPHPPTHKRTTTGPVASNAMCPLSSAADLLTPVIDLTENHNPQSREEQQNSIDRNGQNTGHKPAISTSGTDTSQKLSPKRSSIEGQDCSTPKKIRHARVANIDEEPTVIDVDTIVASKTPVGAERDVIDLEEIFDFTAEQAMFAPTSRVRTSIPTRNEPIKFPFVRLLSVEFGTRTLRKGKWVEIVDGSFIEINCILRDSRTTEVFVRGWRALRTTRLKGMLETGVGTKNELFYAFDVDLDDKRAVNEQAVAEVPLSDILRIRRVTCTNKLRGDDVDHRYRVEDLPIFESREALNRYISEREWMVLRWVYIKEFQTASDRIAHSTNPRNCVRWVLRRLTESECKSEHSISEKALRSAWCSDRARQKYEDQDGIVEIDSEEFKLKKKKYTMFDSFCGLGGATRGAQAAGLKVKHAFDAWGEACHNYEMNFPLVNTMQKTVTEFCASSDPRGQFIVDVLHLSCPCQLFSPCHTRALMSCPNDEANYAASFCIAELLRETRPRLVSSEQTFGFLHDKFAQNFNIFLSQLTDFGFSVSWQVVKFQNYGLSQKRRRLIMMAAAPGETLPELPRYTHSEHARSGTLPLVVPRQVFRQIPRNAPSHFVHSAMIGKGPFPLWNDTIVFPYTVCTQGIRDEKTKLMLGHPSGLRYLTTSELAALQGFPSNHIIESLSITHIRKLIGNAYPPCIAKVVFEACRVQLELTDHIE